MNGLKPCDGHQTTRKAKFYVITRFSFGRGNRESRRPTASKPARCNYRHSARAERRPRRLDEQFFTGGLGERFLVLGQHGADPASVRRSDPAGGWISATRRPGGKAGDRS